MRTVACVKRPGDTNLPSSEAKAKTSKAKTGTAFLAFKPQWGTVKMPTPCLPSGAGNLLFGSGAVDPANWRSCDEKFQDVTFCFSRGFFLYTG